MSVYPVKNNKTERERKDSYEQLQDITETLSCIEHAIIFDDFSTRMGSK